MITLFIGFVTGFVLFALLNAARDRQRPARRVSVVMVQLSDDGEFRVETQDGSAWYGLPEDVCLAGRANALAVIDRHDLSTAEVHLYQRGTRLRPLGVAQLLRMEGGRP